ncbi:MAG: GDYXXLXY domain-containing protein [Parvibaculum sp.]|uniref:GDYXXLXY domain-containing protein n=1 Tax=Parvibaculum sp. TaxID=2024848 RepID=UPI002ABC9EC8|nr:GDYXXLXY domain-containing protein [Parvibaculum sp.]MDZ4380338.1 GDYXXLXY domain-containing protein [Parvibaculum sp.]
MSRFALAVLALLIGQSLFLGAMVFGRVSLLRSENVVTLRTAPVDPRDIFRGDYVILSYDIARIRLADVDGDDDFGYDDGIFVELAPDGETWNAVAIWRENREPQEDHLIIRGQVNSIVGETRPTGIPERDSIPCPNCGTVGIDYGIESYFVPEGEGRELENIRNDGKLTVDVALGKDGTPAIKQLRIDGEPVYEEPLF